MAGAAFESGKPQDVDEFELSLGVQNKKNSTNPEGLRTLSPNIGLTSKEAAELLEKWDRNDIPVIEKSFLVMFASQFYGESCSSYYVV